MERKVAITTDSTADLSPDLVEKYNIHVIPLGIEMDGQVHRDGIDAVPDDLYDYYKKTGKTAHSSAGSIGEYQDLFRELTEQGYDVVHIALADFLSCTQQNAKLAAEDFDGVYIVNSRRLSSGMGLLVLRAAELAQQGLSAKEIADTAESLSYKADVSFVLDTLDYMCAGGRCSSVTKLGANLLKIKPQIVVYDDKMDTGKKYRGKIQNCRMQYIEEQLHDVEDIDLSRVFFTHSGMAQDEIDQLVAKIKSVADFKEIIVQRAGCVISCHCGPGTCGVLFFRKSNIF